MKPTNYDQESTAWIKISPSEVTIDFPDKREDFRSLLKNLGFYWSGSIWKRDIKNTTGTAYDRAAEAGYVLLKNGFQVKIDDVAVRHCAFAGLFEPEHTLWIGKRDGGIYDGWFTLMWSEKNDALYEASRRLPGSRWSNPDVVVPADQYEEVLDFAHIHGFKLTPEAKFLCRYGKILKYSMLKAKPVKRLDFCSEEFKRMDDAPAFYRVCNCEVDNEFKD